MKSKSLAPLVGILALVAITFTQSDIAHADIPPSTVRVSIAYDGSEANGSSNQPSISADGRYVAFRSAATNLVPGDTNSDVDIFVRDRVANSTVRVNVSNLGDQTNGGSADPRISGNGKYVVFSSYASNLVPDDSNAAVDIFLYDLQLGTIERVNLNDAGFQTQPADSSKPDVSHDGRFVAFVSGGSNLAPPCDGGIFVRDRTLAHTICVSVDSDGNPLPGTSSPTISGDGRFVAFTGGEVYVRDLLLNETTLVSVNSAGIAANDGSFDPDLSYDGRFVAFTTMATNLATNDISDKYDTYVHDRTTSDTTWVSVAYDGDEQSAGSNSPSISYDGEYVVFDSPSSDIIDGGNGLNSVYIRIVSEGTTELASLTWDNWIPNAHADAAVISGDGRFVAFKSEANNIVPGDYNGVYDIFVRDMGVVFDQFVYLPLISR